MLSFMNSDCPNCDAQSSAVFDFSSFLLKTTSFLCFLSLNLIMTFSLFFIRWQTWISSGLMVVPVSDCRGGIKGLWFVNHESISWSCEPEICRISIFYELLFPKYKNFKIISAANICLSICLELMNEIDWRKKEILLNILACFKLRHYTLTWKIRKKKH